MSRLRVGCVGTGFIAGRHLSALATLADVEICAVADTAPGRAEEVAARHGARAYEDGMALLETEALDAVWVCVPPFAHGPLERAAVDRGLPMFVEKPLARDLSTAVGVADRVRQAGLLTGVGYHWRFLSVVQDARRLVQDPPARLVTGTWLDRTPGAPWWSRRAHSGGQLIEQTTHLVDLARLLVGEIDTVQALEAAPIRDAGSHADVPSASAVLMRFASGAIGTMSSSCVLDRRHRVGMQLVLEGRTLDLAERSLTDHELRFVHGKDETVTRTGEDPIAAEDRAFVDALIGGEPTETPVSYAEALLTHAAVCAADHSARMGGVPVQVASYLHEASSGLGQGPAEVARER